MLRNEDAAIILTGFSTSLLPCYTPPPGVFLALNGIRYS